MANTTRQVELWKPGDAITSVRLNEMAEAINFLLNTSGYIFNRVALANYNATESSGTNFDYPGIIQEVEMGASNVSPHINAGRLVIPRGEGGEALTGVSYDATASAPYIASNALFLNYASASSGSNYPGAIAGLELYDPADPSAPASPGIFNGVITIPSASSATTGITDVYYDENETIPHINNGTLYLNVADSLQGSYPGSVFGVQTYDPADPSAPAEPCIDMGVIKVPFGGSSGVTSVSYGATEGTTPAPGVDGWVQTLLILGSYQNGSLQFTRWDRQLMRVHGNTLQVVQQESFDDGNSWSERSA